MSQRAFAAQKGRVTVGLRVYLAGIGRSPSATEGFHRLAEQDRHRKHVVEVDPAVADIILFTDLHLLPHDIRLKTLRSHAVYQSYPEKCFVYDERDHPWSNMPGLYVSMPAYGFDPARQVAVAYYMLNRPDVPEVHEPRQLFAFLGSRSHALRAEVLKLRHPRAVIDDTTGFVFYTAADGDERRQRFGSVLADSKFVLCPRGTGTSSIRLFETLAAGRVPVIISDRWVEPAGPDWSAISLRWPESDVSDLPAYLESREADWPSLAAGTCEAFNTFFAQEVAWHHLIGSLDTLRRSGLVGGFAPAIVNRQRWAAEVVHANWCARAHIRKAAGAVGISRKILEKRRAKSSATSSQVVPLGANHESRHDRKG